MKKSIFLFITAILFAFAANSQTPQAFKYQAVARDLSGSALVSKNVSFRISILQGSASGTSVYSEKHTKTTNAFGLVDLEIGNGSSPTGSFSAIDWAGNTYFLKVEMDPNGGSAYQLMGTSQLLSVPYAIQAEKAEEVADNSVTATKIANNAVTVAKLPAGATASTFLRGDGTWQTPATGASATPGGDEGSVQYNHRSTFTGDNNLFWDYVNKRLGIGTNTPYANLNIRGVGTTTNPNLLVNQTDPFTPAIFRLQNYEAMYWDITGNSANNGQNHELKFNHNLGGTIMTLDKNGNVAIGKAISLNYRLSVAQTGNGNYGTLDLTNTGAYPTLKVSNTSNTGYAALFNGVIYVAGEKGELNREQTGTANMVPICYGAYHTGSIVEGTGNFSVVWNAASLWYEITITGESYHYMSYVTMVTPLSTGLLPSTSSVGGKLIVRLTNLSGNQVQGNFSIVVYKP